MPVERILPERAKELLEESEEYVYLDVRTVEEFRAGHVPGAINVPILERSPDGPGLQPNTRFLEQVSVHFECEARIITGCLRGGRSLRAAEILVANGFTRVVDMRGGWDGELDPTGVVVCAGWARLGYPVSHD